MDRGWAKFGKTLSMQSGEQGLRMVAVSGEHAVDYVPMFERRVG
jgi:hypothetical protein